MSQSRKESFIESCVNVAIGYSIAIFTQMIIFPLFDIEVSMSQNFAIAAVFTCISLARSYLIRRFFNARIKQFVKEVSK